MRQSLFATFRGSDGRSMAWALALLLLVNIFAVGANIGFAAGSQQVFCAIGDAHGGDAPVAPGHADPCCLAGCLTSTAGIDPAVVALPLPAISSGPIVRSTNAIAVTLPRLAGHRPRGPPLLA